jgi:ABC-type sugar transport system permease subunit
METNPQPQQVAYIAAPYPTTRETPISIGDWIITFIVQALPLVGLIFIVYLALSSSTPLTKRNYARAILVLWAISFVIVILMWLTGINIFGAFLRAGSQ